MRELTILFLLLFVSFATAGQPTCSAYYVRWPRVRLNFKSVANARLSLRACESACSLGEDPQMPGRSLECAALNHHPAPDGFAHQCDVFQPHQLQNVDGYVEADDRYSFFWKYCLNSTRKCGGEYAFTYLSDRYMDSRDVIRVTKKNSLEECLVECLDEKSIPCRSISFNRTDGGCHVSADSQLTKPQAIRLNNNPNFRIDYYENNCYNLSDTFKFEQECREDGIFVKVKSKFPYTGALYGLYDFFTCRIEPKESTEFGYLFPSPTASRNCSDSIRFQGDEMVLDVVLSTDGIEPLYFITPDDLTYQAKCPIVGKTSTEKIIAVEETKQQKSTTESASTNSLAAARTTPLKMSTSKAKLFKQTYPLPLSTTQETLTTSTDGPFKQVVQQIIRAHLEKTTQTDEDLLGSGGELLNEQEELFLAQHDPPAKLLRTQFQAPIVDFFAKLTTDGDALEINAGTTPSPNQQLTNTSVVANVAKSPGNINEASTGTVQSSIIVAKPAWSEQVAVAEARHTSVNLTPQKPGPVDRSTTVAQEIPTLVTSEPEAQNAVINEVTEETTSIRAVTGLGIVQGLKFTTTKEPVDEDAEIKQLLMAPLSERLPMNLPTTTVTTSLTPEAVPTSSPTTNRPSEATASPLAQMSTREASSPPTPAASTHINGLDRMEAVLLSSPEKPSLSPSTTTKAVEAEKAPTPPPVGVIEKIMKVPIAEVRPFHRPFPLEEVVLSQPLPRPSPPREGLSKPRFLNRSQGGRLSPKKPPQSANASFDRAKKASSAQAVVEKIHETPQTTNRKFLAVPAAPKPKVILIQENQRITAPLVPTKTVPERVSNPIMEPNKKSVARAISSTSSVGPVAPKVNKEKRRGEVIHSNDVRKPKPKTTNPLVATSHSHPQPKIMTETVKASIRMDTSKIEAPLLSPAKNLPSKHEAPPRSPARNLHPKQTKELVEDQTRENRKPLAKKISNRDPGTSKKKLKLKKSDFFVRRRSLMIPIRMTPPSSEGPHQDAPAKGEMPAEKPAGRNAPKITSAVHSKEVEHRKAVEGVKTTHVQQVQVPPHSEHFAKKKVLTVKNGVVQRIPTQDPDPLDELVPLLENHHLSQRMMTLLRFLAASMEKARRQHLSHRKEVIEQRTQRTEQRRRKKSKARRNRGQSRRGRRVPLNREPALSLKNETHSPVQVETSAVEKLSRPHRGEENHRTKIKSSSSWQKSSAILKQQMVEPANSLKEEAFSLARQDHSRAISMVSKEESLFPKQGRSTSSAKKLSTSHPREGESRTKAALGAKRQKATIVLKQQLARQATSTNSKEEASILTKLNHSEANPIVLRERTSLTTKHDNSSPPAEKLLMNRPKEDETQTKVTLSARRQTAATVLKQHLARQATPTDTKEQPFSTIQGRSQSNPTVLWEKTSSPLAKQKHSSSSVKKSSKIHVKDDESQTKAKFNGKMQKATAILRQHLARQANSSLMNEEASAKHEPLAVPKRFVPLQRQAQSLESTTTSATTQQQKVLPKKQTPAGKRSTPRKALRAPSTATPSHLHLASRQKTTPTTTPTKTTPTTIITTKQTTPSTTTARTTTRTTARPTTTTTTSTTTTTRPTTTTRTTTHRPITTTASSTTTTTTAKPTLNRSPALHTAGPPAPPTKPSEPTKPVKGAVSFDIFHNGQPVEAVVVGTKIMLSFAPLYAIPPEYMSVRECQVEPIDSKYEWEREPLPIIREGCQADLVGLVCPPKQSEFGVKVAVESFRYQSTPHVQYSCLVRVCPFAPCPPANCPPVDGCPRDKRAARSLSLEEIRRALEADPKLASQIGISPHVLANRPGHSVSVESQLLALGGDHTVKRRLVVVNSEDQLRYYVRTGDVP
ncbi:hypothetical protein Y032_0177g575 [Ancylostoma ceylanicum]|uniref:Apple domain-containing protein n=1 Tax=Ancylostoma ceylanicum TaxID=53326 RepID=A0A016SU41_9BILA|nr:hypothetical protein Y032_0177g575 [Ancylostoma ceylanicum]